MPTAPDPAEVLAWMAAEGAGYKRAARHFGLSPDQVREWAGRAAHGRPTRPRARGRQGLTPEAVAAAALVAPDKSAPDWDPSACSRHDYLAERLRVAVGQCARWTDAGHGGVARQWEDQASKYRAEIDTLAREQAEAERWRELAERHDPAELATRIARLAPLLGRLVPQEARALAEALIAALPREVRG